ncbi:hypothetical protein CcI49_33465 [Frankia sp. CcI49]|nr:hypothetical protein CcI49_33465 [Frankia sp. CcI49]
MIPEVFRPIVDVARELGVVEENSESGSPPIGTPTPGETPSPAAAGNARIRELERQNRELAMEGSFLKSRGVLRRGSSPSDTFEFIDAEYAARTTTNTATPTPSITRMCAWLQVSRSGSHERRGRPASATATRRDELAALVQRSSPSSTPPSPWITSIMTVRI